MALAKTGYTSTTSKNYVVDAATIWTNFTYDEVGGMSGTPLGATSGGVSVTIEQTYRDVEVDGTRHMKVKGNKRLESATATATANMKEITAELIRRSINGTLAAAGASVAPAGYKVITTKRNVEDADYIENMAVVGILSGTTEPVVIVLDNALCTSGLELATEDNAEAVIEQTYEAHATVTQLQVDEFPWRILFPADQTISIAPASVTLSLAETDTQQLTATTTPVGVTVEYKTNDASVATVSPTGLVTGLAVGTAIITATTSGGTTDTCLVTVAV